VNLLAISTPIAECVVLRVGPMQASTVVELQARHYDQAPVLEGELVIGTLPSSRATHLLTSGQNLTTADPELIRDSIEADANIETLLGVMSHARSVLVGSDGAKVALLTISDLNRHPLRAPLYARLAELESLLARLVDLVYDDPWIWLSGLRDDVQAKLIGQWELSKRRNVDVGPIPACTMRELFDVLQRGRVHGELGFGSRTTFRDACEAVLKVRNRVMHPVRALVLGHDDVAATRNVVELADSMTRNARAAIERRGADRRSLWL